MARFFFHLHDCGTFIEDPEGRDFPSLDDAVEQAKSDARGLLAAEIAEGKLCLGCRIELVEESTGQAIIIPFATTVHLESAIAEKPPAI